jgi:hypothetical protein
MERRSPTKTMAQGLLSPQSLIVLGGNSNANDTAFGNLVCQFELGDLLLFDALLSATDLIGWERFAGARSGIIF